MRLQNGNQILRPYVRPMRSEASGRSGKISGILKPARPVRMCGRPSEHAMHREFLSEPERIACDREVRMRLGQALRAAYGPLVSQSLPEHIAGLVRRLDDRKGDEARSGPPGEPFRSV